MPENVEANGAEVSDAMSENENEYDDTDHPLKEDEDDKMAEHHTSSEAGAEGSGEVKKKYDPKDPHRPRRKKARRACYACQRAHLTCGDERPCQRCIKRGLADACQDGVRKKAKYLHDAPPEALRPVLGPTFNPNVVTKPNGRHLSNATSESSSYYPQSTSSQTYPIFTGSQPQVTMSEAMPFSGQPSPVSPSFQQPSNQRVQQIANMQVQTPTGDMTNYSSSALFDPSNPAIFNFDLEGLNFGSQYGAMEFGILGHMSSGAAETPPTEARISQHGGNEVNYGGGSMYHNGMNQYNQIYESGILDNYMNADQSGNMYSQGNLQHGLPHAYAIAAAGPTPSSLASPGTENTASPQPSHFLDGSPSTSTYAAPTPQVMTAPPRTKTKSLTNNQAKVLGPQSILGKRQRDPSAIYETVKEPYPYVKAFHKLTGLVQRRFSRDKTIHVAKSLASVRPSFISCTRNLNQQDLVFMEKCLQRTLFEFEDLMGHISAPTIVCRRTGEVAAVNKAFIALTGWSKEVLLGREANLNINTGRSAANSEKSSLNTPQLRAMEPTKSADGKPQSVFIAECMDDESVIQFYDDFAQLAYSDSRGHVTRKCRLLKYRTSEQAEMDESPQKDPRNSILSNRVTRIDGEHGISKIEKDGKVDCTYTWTIKQDIFNIPMLIVMNFLPCYYRNHDQLAV